MTFYDSPFSHTSAYMSILKKKWIFYAYNIIISYSFSQNGNIWLNDTSLSSINEEGFVTSLTVYPGVANKLTLKFGGSLWQWTITFNPRKHHSFNLNLIRISWQELVVRK